MEDSISESSTIWNMARGNLNNFEHDKRKSTIWNMVIGNPQLYGH
jgi:hypothetical protein